MDWIVVLVVVGLAGIGVVVVGLFFAGGAAMLVRGRRPDPAVLRDEGLKRMGYDARQDGTYAYPIQGTTMVFRARPDGLEWALQLPRYNTMTLELAEKSSGRTPEHPFAAGVHAIDARFLLGSPTPDRIVTLLKQPKLQKALLRMHDLALTLSADELLIRDPGKPGADADQPEDPVEAELDVHAQVINIVNALFGTLYGEGGTVLDMYR